MLIKFFTGFLFFTIAFLTHCQTLIYSPWQTLEKTVDKSYYGTEYIFIRNNVAQSVDLEFELISENFPSSWSVTGCTNLICYSNLPDKGTLGIKQQNEEWYMSLNIAVNQQLGEGVIKFRLFSSNTPSINDTLVFKIKAEESELIEIKPWAEFQYNENGITIFTQSNVEATFLLFNLSGQTIMNEQLTEVSTFSFANLSKGVYVVYITSKQGKKLVKKIHI